MCMVYIRVVFKILHRSINNMAVSINKQTKTYEKCYMYTNNQLLSVYNNKSNNMIMAALISNKLSRLRKITSQTEQWCIGRRVLYVQQHIKQTFQHRG